MDPPSTYQKLKKKLVKVEPTLTKLSGSAHASFYVLKNKIMENGENKIQQKRPTNCLSRPTVCLVYDNGHVRSITGSMPPKKRSNA